MDIAPDYDHKRKYHLTTTEKRAFISNKLQLQNQSSIFTKKDKSLDAPTNILSGSLMAHNTTASLNKLICTVTFSNSKTKLDIFLSP